MKFFGILILTGLVFLVAPNTSKAAVINLSSNYQTVTLPDGSNPFSLDSETGLVAGTTDIKAYIGVEPSDLIGGLSITGNANITFTYLGMEAGFQNKFFYNGLTPSNELFETRTVSGGAGSATGPGNSQTFSYVDTGDFLSFSFWSGKTFSGGTPNPDIFVENGSINPKYSIGFSLIDPLSAVILFGDGWGDSDFDDMAVLLTVESVPSVVPLPPSAILFGTALIGLGALRRRRKKPAAK